MLSAGIAAVLLCACNPKPEHALQATPAPVPSAGSTSGVPPLKITGRGPLRIVEQRGNRKVYELLAKSYVSRSAQAGAEAVFRAADVTFYDKDGSTLTAAAPVATVDQRTKQVTLTGGVHARTSSGLHLTCDRLVYFDATGQVHGTGNVVMTRREGDTTTTIRGNSFESDVKLQQMRMQM